MTHCEDSTLPSLFLPSTRHFLSPRFSPVLPITNEPIEMQVVWAALYMLPQCGVDQSRSHFLLCSQIDMAMANLKLNMLLKIYTILALFLVMVQITQDPRDLNFEKKSE